MRVGKESNRFEDLGAWIEHDSDEVWTEYQDPRRDPWETLAAPVLKQIPAQWLVDETGLAMSTVKAARYGHTNPHGRNRKAFMAAAGALARQQLQEFGILAPADKLTCCTTSPPKSCVWPPLTFS